jgi:hypothetical protein
MAALPSNPTAELLRLIEPERGPGLPEPRRKRGRPKALNNQRLGRLLKAVAEIHSKNKMLRNSNIAAALKKRTEYATFSQRTLRRYVAKALRWELGNLKITPPPYWQEILGILPPPYGSVLTKKVLRDKAFELLRHHLRQHELLAKK